MRNIFIACDTNSVQIAKKIIRQSRIKLKGYKIGYKFGLEFFYSKGGREYISSIKNKQIFLDLKIEDNKAMAKSFTDIDPGFLPIPSKNYIVGFGNRLSSGEEPDDAIPNGTQIEVIVKAENDEGSDVETSNAITPSVPNPIGSAGPITGIDATTSTNSYYSHYFSTSWLLTAAEVEASATPITNNVDASGGYIYVVIEPNCPDDAGPFFSTNSVDGTGASFQIGSTSPDIQRAHLVSSCKDSYDDAWLTLGKIRAINGGFNGAEWPLFGYGDELLYNQNGSWGFYPNPNEKVMIAFASSNTNCFISAPPTLGNLSGVPNDGVATALSTDLTVSSSVNLDAFVVGDSLKMVDIDGAVASYLPVTIVI